MRILHRDIVFVCAASLSGCAGFVSRPIPPAESAAAFEARRLDGPELRADLKNDGITVGARWSLTALAAASRHLNPNLAVQQARFQTAIWAVRTAGERPNPTLSLKPGYNTSTSGIPPWIVEPSFDITLETGGKRAARRAAALAKMRAAGLELDQAAWKVRTEIRRGMLALHAAQVTREQYQAQENAQAEATKLLESQFKGGAATPQDVAAARISLNKTRLAKHDTDMAAAKARGQLASAVGVSVAALDGLSLDFSEVTRLPPPLSSGAARSHALSHRTDILAALADYAASEELLRLEVANQYPDIKLGPGYKLDQTSNKWTLGIGFELPIFHQHQGAIAESEGRRQEAAARFLSVQATALAEIDVALSVYRSARAKADAAGAIASDMKSQTSAAEIQKNAGEISLIEVSQRRVEQGAANLASEQAGLQALEAAGALEDALQTPSKHWK